MGLKQFREVFAEEIKKEQGPEVKAKAIKLIFWSTIVSSVVWAVWAVAAAIMLVGMGAWGWVIWPIAVYWWTNHVARGIATYTKAKKPAAKWEQNVVVNVNTAPEMTAEQISEAASRAVNERLQYGLKERAGQPAP